MTKRSKLLRTAEIKGFLIAYEKTGGQIFAIGYCPQCGERIETLQLEVDAGFFTVEKITAHLAANHPGQAS
jgi:hypothetical protein